MTNCLTLNKSSKRWSRFAEETTLHGFPEWYKSRHGGHKIFWIIIIVLAFALAGYEIYMVFDDYLERPIINKYDWYVILEQCLLFSNGFRASVFCRHPATAFQFPQVEICANSMINNSRLKELKMHSQFALMLKRAEVNSIFFSLLEEIFQVAPGDIFDYPVFVQVVTQPTEQQASIKMVANSFNSKIPFGRISNAELVLKKGATKRLLSFSQWCFYFRMK